MTLAIAILNWNGKPLLQKYLNSVIDNSKETDIYIIDNGSTDDSIPFLRENHPMVNIVSLKKNHGFAKGYNLGLKEINADVFCLLNNDVRVTKAWTESILRLFQQNENIAVIQPKILDAKRPDYFEYAGAAGGFIDNLGYPYCRGRVFWDIEKDKGQYDDTTEIFWASGACYFIRSKDFWDMEGFDSSFFAHQEEIDLCWRLKNNGKMIYYCGDSAIYHQGAATLKMNSKKKTYLNIRNSLFMLVKNLPKNELFPIIFTRMIFDGISSFYFGFKNGPALIWAVFKAHVDFYRDFAKVKRKKSIAVRKFTYTRFLPIQYFIKGRNSFTELQ